jgi:hypothetical protein
VESLLRERVVEGYPHGDFLIFESPEPDPE